MNQLNVYIIHCMPLLLFECKLQSLLIAALKESKHSQVSGAPKLQYFWLTIISMIPSPIA